MLLAQKAARPSDSIAQGASDPAAAKGAYRFVENERVTADLIWNPVHADTAHALGDLREVYVPQDTTFLMFPTLEATEGLGTANDVKREALVMHSALALRPDGHVVGLLGNTVWARPPQEFGKAALRKSLPIERKESFKWLRTMRHACALRDRYSPRTTLVHVQDREADIYEVLAEAGKGSDEAVIRWCRPRKVDGEHETVHRTVAAQPVLKRMKVAIPRSKGRSKRSAHVTVRSAQVTLQPPQRLASAAPLTLNVVWVHEPKPPEGVDGVEWLLWTTLPVGTAKACMKVVRAYKLRWRIEDFHRVLKDGCRIERTQLKTAERIETWLALCCAVAVRLLQLTHWARLEPDAPCTAVLSDEEWQVLWAYHHKRPIPRGLSPPTMREAVRMIGRLGGHLGRKCDAMPGVRSLWKGWRDLDLLVQGARIRL